MIRTFVFVLLSMSVIAFPFAVQASDEIEDNVLVVVKDGEAMAFSAHRNHWVKLKLHSDEKVLESKSGGNVAVVVTSRRILGYSETVDRWSQVRLHVDERFHRVQASGNVATVETSLRVLGFSATEGDWVVAE